MSNKIIPLEEDEITPEAARAYLWDKSNLLFKLDENQIELYNSYKNAEDKIVVWSCSRRLGKCLAEGTEVSTPKGPIAIEKLKIGDEVYGFNEDGTISPAKVINVFDQGEKEVVDIIVDEEHVATSTLDHLWLSYNRRYALYTQKKLGQFTQRDKLIKRYIEAPLGLNNEPKAYSLGISYANNYRTIDYEELSNWNRDSCLRLLASIIDHYGYVNNEHRRLFINISFPGEKILILYQFLILRLFQHKISYKKSSKTAQWLCITRNNSLTVRILRETSKYIDKPFRKIKDKHENYIGVKRKEIKAKFKLTNPRKARCYDISIDNSTKFFLTATGFVTHNSYTLCVIAIEECLKKKNAIVKFLAPKQKDVKSIIRPLMRQLIADAPDKLRPVEKIASGIWYFPSTNSEIQIAGCDNGRAESVRGGGSSLCVVDEAGFTSDLEYIVKAILLPTTTTTKGKIILASTPPKSPAHDFVKFIRRAEIRGSFVKKTIYDNPRLTKEDIADMAEEVGGVDSVDFRREYLAEIITDEHRAIVPEFTKELQNKIVKPWVKPAFYDGYVAMDLGLKDLTVVLFAYYDFRHNKVIIEDEFVINGQKLTTTSLADGIKLKEKEVFSDSFTGEQKDPYLRVSDNNLIVINDLYQLHGISFIPTRKDDADAALNNMRILLKDEKIIIHPRCATLIRHLETGIWNKAKTSFDRSEDNAHFDAVDSLKYLIRNINFTHNPFPSSYGALKESESYNQKKTQVHSQTNNIRKILNIKSS